MSVAGGSDESRSSSATPEGGEDPSSKRPRARRRLIWTGILVLLLIWAGAVAVDLLDAVRQVHQGNSQVQAARSTLSADGLLSGTPMAPLQAAESSFASAHQRLSSPLLWPIDVLPFVGRQLSSVRDLSEAAEQVSHVGLVTVGQTKALLKLPHSAGPDRITTLDRLSALASTTDDSLNQVNLGPSQHLLGFLVNQRTKFSNELDQVRTTLSRTAAAAAAAAKILQGPQSYLLLAANNAEMRSGSGAFLEAGAFTTNNGEFHLNGMVPTTTLQEQVGAVPITGDLQARWGWLMPGVDWRNLGLTPQFDVNGPLAARMWKTSTGQQVDGVMALDVSGLKDLLNVTGPLTLSNGTVVSSANVDQLLLHDQYIGESYGSVSQESARVDQLGLLASTMLHSLETQPLDLHTLVDALADATAGRHLMLWSADPATEQIWRSTGVSGELKSNSMVSSLINRGGNKLDPYMSMHTNLTLATHGQTTSADMTVTLVNHTPPGQSEFIAGPFPGLGATYGEYVGVVSVNLPNDVRGLSVGPGETVVSNGEEGPTLLVAVNVAVLPGATGQVSFHFTFPQSSGSFTVIPSTHIPPVTWTVNGDVFDDTTPHTVNW